MKKIILILFLLLSVCVFSEETKEVVVEGQGITEEEALQDAMKNAVMQIIGVSISSTTLVKNAQLIDLEILTFSNGYIDEYFKISSSKESELFSVKIKAKVKLETVRKKLQELKISIIKVDVDKSKVDAILQRDIFNNMSLDNFGKEFENYVIKPIVDGSALDIELLGHNIYEIKNKAKEINHGIKIPVRKISNSEDLEISITTYNNFTYNSTDMFWGEYEDYFLLEILYKKTLKKDYINNVKWFCENTAEKKYKGVSKIDAQDINGSMLKIISSKNFTERDMIDNVYTFGDKQNSKLIDAKKIYTEGFDKYFPDKKRNFEISLMNEDEDPILKCIINYGESGATSTSKRLLSIDEYKNKINLSNDELEFFRTKAGTGIKYENIKDINMSIIKNDKYDFIAYVLLKKDEVKDLKKISLEYIAK